MFFCCIFDKRMPQDASDNVSIFKIFWGSTPRPPFISLSFIFHHSKGNLQKSFLCVDGGIGKCLFPKRSMMECAKRSNSKLIPPWNRGYGSEDTIVNYLVFWSWAHSMVLQRLEIHLLQGSQLSCIERETHILTLSDVTRELPGGVKYQNFPGGGPPDPTGMRGHPFTPSITRLCSSFVCLTSTFLVLRKKCHASWFWKVEGPAIIMIIVKIIYIGDQDPCVFSTNIKKCCWEWWAKLRVQREPEKSGTVW